MTLTSALEHASRRKPEQIAIISGEERISYGELDRDTSALARWLLARGVHPGDRVALHWPNSTDLVVLLFACFKAGAVPVPLNVRLKASELAWILRDADVSLYFASPSVHNAARTALAGSGLDIAIHEQLPNPAEDDNSELPSIREHDLCALLYTSGTTARPKGVMHNHLSLLAGARFMNAMAGDAGDVWMATTPLVHASGLIGALLPAILECRSLVLLPVLSPTAILDGIERHRVTFTGGLPFMITMLTEEQQKRPRDVSSLKVFVSGGDAVPLAVHETFSQVFGLPVLELLAMTESCPMLWNTIHDVRPGSVGKVRSSVAVQVLTPTGEACTDGELVVQSPATFLGYWKDDVATGAALRDGWLHTGDLVRLEDDGTVWFAGRVKHIIVRGGSNVSPVEVEEVLLQHPDVFEAGVTSTPDPLYGQRVEAFVVLRIPEAITEQTLQEFARASLSDYKVPDRIWFVAEIPKGITGKVDRRAMAEWASQSDTLPQQKQARV